MKSSLTATRLARSLLILVVILGVSAMIASWAGYERIGFSALRNDEVARAVFFRLRLPRDIGC